MGSKPERRTAESYSGVGASHMKARRICGEHHREKQGKAMLETIAQLMPKGRCLYFTCKS
jgi:hypothetical protein